MPIFTPDFSEISKPIKPGKYPVRVADFAVARSQNTGEQYIKWDLEFIDGEFKGYKRQYNTMLGGKGAGILKHFLGICIAGYDDGPFDPQTIVGTRMTALFAEEEYNGKVSVKIKSVFPLEESNGNAPSFESFGSNERF